MSSGASGEKVGEQRDFKRVNLLCRLLQKNTCIILFLSNSIRYTVSTVSPKVNYKLDVKDVSI